MSATPEGPDPDLLFDLPLDPLASEPEERDAHAAGPTRRGAGDQAALAFPTEDEPPSPRVVEAPLAPRFVAAVLDLVALIAVLGISLTALRLLDVPISRRVLAPLGVFLGCFSFLYQVMPLAFWGHTPGMAYAGIHSRAKDGDFLTMGQCILRWSGWLLTLATAGLGGLVALSGVSLSDLLSGSRSFVRDDR